MDDGREIVFEQARFFSWPEAGKNENRFANTRFANGDALVRTSDAKPVGARLFEGFGDLRAAVAVLGTLLSSCHGDTGKH